MPPGLDAYATRLTLAGTYENQMLYAMCRDACRHDDAEHVRGKLIAIGRIYAASPERGAGKPRDETRDVFDVLADALCASDIDAKLDGIPADWRYDHGTDMAAYVHDLHKHFVETLQSSISEHCVAPKTGAGIKGRAYTSFASKYLHFHRPNSIPILDSIARHGLHAAGRAAGLVADRPGLKAPVTYRSYARYCLFWDGFAKASADANWTQRSIDTALLDLGRAELRRLAGVK
ncbi:hypothetical protein [Tateyamaria sp. SN6-1]|uniref:hypothetical protein n=1 Tax=Tateyamaria sp. SN6-1 TaxID=3092148 RepID=UPI0039F5A8F5